MLSAIEAIESAKRDNEMAREAVLGGKRDEETMRAAGRPYYEGRLDEVREQLWPVLPKRARRDLQWAFDHHDGSGIVDYLRKQGTRRLGSQVWLIAAAVVTIAIGVGLILARRSFEQRATETESWPSVPGEVLGTEVEVSRYTSRSSSNRPGGGGGGTTRTTTYYTPKVEYRYEVEGRQYRSDRLWLAGSVPSESEANALLEPYVVGATVDVYYDPGRPSEAVLLTGAEDHMLLYTGVGSIFILLGLMFVVIVVRTGVYAP